jgi:hypothetical protein
MIRKNGNEFCVYGKEGREMGCYGSRGEAERRLSQIEYFADKSGKGKDEKWDRKKGGGKKGGGKKK